MVVMVMSDGSRLRQAMAIFPTFRGAKSRGIRVLEMMKWYLFLLIPLMFFVDQLFTSAHARDATTAALGPSEEVEIDAR